VLYLYASVRLALTPPLGRKSTRYTVDVLHDVPKLYVTANTLAVLTADADESVLDVCHHT